MTSAITSHSYLFSSSSPSGSLNKYGSLLIASVSFVRSYLLVSMLSFAVISDAFHLLL